MLYHKIFRHAGEEMYLYYPGAEQRTPFKRSALLILLDQVNEESVRKCMEDMALEDWCRDEEVILAFPDPGAGGWASMTHEKFRLYYDGLSKPDDDPLPTNAVGIPTLEAMLGTWHPMHDVRYVIGLGSGADYALRLGAERPEWLAGVWAPGGRLQPGTEPVAPMPVWLSETDAYTVSSFCRANQTDAMQGEARWCSRNPAQRVVEAALPVNGTSLRRVWKTLFRRVRRVNTCIHGDVTDRMEDARNLFACFVEDDRLDGKPHTWFVHVPRGIACGERVPLVVFFHGGSDNPAEAAEMSRVHELGEREKFITVYPWGTNRCSWNSGMEPDQEDDDAFSVALIRHMIRSYPVDARRVYLTGFSNGAAQAQSVALCHPEMIAAIFHIDSNWPGIRGKYCELDWRDVIPFQKAMERKRRYDFRMPVWYTYGSREVSYPVWRGSTQQHQYDFWKMYNHVEVRPTPAMGEAQECPCGVAGDEQEILRPSARYPHHWYEVQRFRDDRGENIYNYVVMHDKGHEVAEMDVALGWQYARRFQRLPDGSLLRVE